MSQISETVSIVTVSQQPGSVPVPGAPATSTPSTGAYVTVRMQDGTTLQRPINMSDAASYVVGKQATLSITPI